MKNRMLISVFLPAIGKTFDFWIPREYSIAYVATLLSYYFARQHLGYIPDKDTFLCERKSGRILNGTLPVDHLEKMNNPELMLI